MRGILPGSKKCSITTDNRVQEWRTRRTRVEHGAILQAFSTGTSIAISIGMGDFPHFELTHKIISAIYKVHNELGHGFSEKIYRKALAIALRELGLDAIEECQIKVFFHGALIGTFIVDIVVDGKIIIEVKPVKELESRDEAQLLNYLKCAGGGTGLLVNFGRTLSYKRLVMGNPLANLPNLAEIAESEG